MIWQTGQSKLLAEAIFRIVQSSYTATGTITAASIARGAP